MFTIITKKSSFLMLPAKIVNVYHIGNIVKNIQSMYSNSVVEKLQPHELAPVTPSLQEIA